MGLTLLAIFSAALLLPGMIAAWIFYYSGRHRELAIPLPPLGSLGGIIMVGGFSILVHMIYVGALRLVDLAPPLTGLPLANPYRAFVDAGTADPLDLAFAFIAGMLLLSLAATGVGWAMGRLVLARMDRRLVYGPFADLVAKAADEERFISASILSKVIEGDRLLGYRGIVDSITFDEDRLPSKIVLESASHYYLTFNAQGPEWVEHDLPVGRLVLCREEWHNISFEVFVVEDVVFTADDQPQIDFSSDVPASKG